MGCEAWAGGRKKKACAERAYRGGPACHQLPKRRCSAWARTLERARCHEAIERPRTVLYCSDKQVFVPGHQPPCHVSVALP